MKRDIDIFIDVYQREIINESFGTMLKNAASNLAHKATFGLVGSTKNNSLSKNLKKTLEECQFNIGDGDDGEDFSKASKVIGRFKGGKIATLDDIEGIDFEKMNLEELKQYKFYKIVISNDYSKDSDEIQYGIKCFNVLTGKSVKIKTNNFKLKTSWNSDEILKAINEVINPLKIEKSMVDLSNEANQVKEIIERKQKEEAENKIKADADVKEQQAKADEEKSKRNETLKIIKQKIEKYNEFINTEVSKVNKMKNSDKNKDKMKDDLKEMRKSLNNLSNNIEDVGDNLDEETFNKIVNLYKDLRGKIQNFSNN